MARNKKVQIPEVISNDMITDLKIEQIIPNMVDDFVVTIFEDHHTLALPMNMTGTDFRSWHKRKGGPYSKDVLNFSLGLPHGKYVLIKSKSLHCVARLITEEEELQFTTMKLVDGKIKDRPYMILKKLEKGEKLSSTQRYINEKDNTQNDNVYIDISDVATQEDGTKPHIVSKSLFSK